MAGSKAKAPAKKSAPAVLNIGGGNAKGDYEWTKSELGVLQLKCKQESDRYTQFPFIPKKGATVSLFGPYSVSIY